MDKSHKLLVTLYYNAFQYKWQAVYLIFYFFRINVLSICAKKHVFTSSFNEYVSILVHQAEVSGMVPSFFVYGLGCSFFILVVAKHYIHSSGKYFACDMLWVFAVNLHLHVYHFFSTRSRNEFLVV